MPKISSITNDLLNDIAGFTADDIDNVLINDTLQVSSFTQKKSDQNMATIEYDVTDDSITEIKNIKLRKANTVLSEADVSISVAESTSFKHLIQIREGM